MSHLSSDKKLWFDMKRLGFWLAMLVLTLFFLGWFTAHAATFPDNATTVTGLQGWSASPVVLINTGEPITVLKIEVDAHKKEAGFSGTVDIQVYCDAYEIPLLGIPMTYQFGVSSSEFRYTGQTDTYSTCPPDGDGDNVSMLAAPLVSATGEIFYSITYVLGSSTATTTQSMSVIIENDLTRNTFYVFLVLAGTIISVLWYLNSNKRG